MNRLVRPTPQEREIKLDPSKTIMSKTNSQGVIEYANEYFMEISGYEEYELMGQPHNVIRHPDMPKVIFKVMWERLHEGGNIHALVKNMSKDGRYYWVLTDFDTKFDAEGNIISHYARRKAAPGNAVFQIEKLYKTLKAIEDNQSAETAEKYFMGLLEEKGMTYDQYILELLEINNSNLNSYFFDAKPQGQQTIKSSTPKKKGLLKRMFT